MIADYNLYQRQDTQRTLKVCDCGAQAVTDKENCPLCGMGMKPMPDKQPSVRRST